MHTYRRGKLTDYGVHLREKQKVKHYYGVLERQFRRYVQRRRQGHHGNTGKTLMSLLERRLDNVVHRLGFAPSRGQARQMVAHGHITGQRPAGGHAQLLVRPGDVIRVKNRPKSLQWVQSNLAESQRQRARFPQLRADGAHPEGHVLRMPEPEDVSIPVQTQLIMELCSK